MSIVASTNISGQTYSRIGGWLILPTIALFLTPFFRLFEIVDIYKAVPSLTVIDALAIMVGLIYLVFNIIVLVFVVKRKRQAPSLAKIFFSLPFILFAVMAVGAYMGPPIDQESAKSFMESGRGAFWQLIWALYFERSKRVKGTFIN